MLKIVVYNFFSGFFNKQASSKEQHLFQTDIFCNITNVCHFYQFNASLLNKSIKIFKKNTYWPQTFEQ